MIGISPSQTYRSVCRSFSVWIRNYGKDFCCLVMNYALIVLSLKCVRLIISVLWTNILLSYSFRFICVMLRAFTGSSQWFPQLPESTVGLPCFLCIMKIMFSFTFTTSVLLNRFDTLHFHRLTDSWLHSLFTLIAYVASFFYGFALCFDFTHKNIIFGTSSA